MGCVIKGIRERNFSSKCLFHNKRMRWGEKNLSYSRGERHESRKQEKAI